jgi:hypothetical protein
VIYVVFTSGSFDLLVEVVCEDSARLLTVIDAEIRAIDGVRLVEEYSPISASTPIASLGRPLASRAASVWVRWRRAPLRGARLPTPLDEARRRIESSGGPSLRAEMKRLSVVVSASPHHRGMRIGHTGRADHAARLRWRLLHRYQPFRRRQQRSVFHECC